MTLTELHQARAAKWSALQAEDVDASRLRHFVRELGLVTFAGGDAAVAALPRIADWPNAAEPVLYELLELELAALHVVEVELWPGARLYAPAELVGYLYVCAGDRRPLTDFRQQARQRKLSWLAAAAFEHLLAAPQPLTVAQLRDHIGAERTSALGVERALAELAASAKVVRTGRRGPDSVWRPLVLALPHIPELVDAVSRVQAAAALVSQWLDTMLCDTEENLAEFFAPVMPRNRAHSALLGLEAGREVLLDALDGRPAYRLAIRAPQL